MLITSSLLHTFFFGAHTCRIRLIILLLASSSLSLVYAHHKKIWATNYYFELLFHVSTFWWINNRDRQRNAKWWQFWRHGNCVLCTYRFQFRLHIWKSGKKVLLTQLLFWPHLAQKFKYFTRYLDNILA